LLFQILTDDLKCTEMDKSKLEDLVKVDYFIDRMKINYTSGKIEDSLIEVIKIYDIEITLFVIISNGRTQQCTL
jgi:hypothetical protein